MDFKRQMDSFVVFYFLQFKTSVPSIRDFLKKNANNMTINHIEMIQGDLTHDR